MAIIGLQKGSGKSSRVREKSVKSQGILIWIMSGNPVSLLWQLKVSIDLLWNKWKLAYLGYLDFVFIEMFIE